MSVKAFMDGKETIEGLQDRITGRYSCEDIYDKDGNLLVGANHMITPARAKRIMDTGVETIEGLQDRITGRYSCEDIYDKDGNLLVGANHMITPARAKRIMDTGVDKKGQPIEEVKIRTILTCRSKSGICEGTAD